MLKIVSFSLTGGDPRLTEGAIENARLILEEWQDWKCVVYTDDVISEHVVSELESLNCDVKFIEDNLDWISENGSSVKVVQMPWHAFGFRFWKFLEADSDNTVICRNVESRVSGRDKSAVEAWLKSDKDFHIIRDHPSHNTPIVADMWGARNGILLNQLKDHMQVWFRNNSRNSEGRVVRQNFALDDTHFLTQIIYPLVKNSSCVHDPFFSKNPFPTEAPKRTANNYAGRIV